MLDKLGGTYAPRPSSGPHKLREALPLTVLLKNRLKYALTGREVTLIVNSRLVKVDGKVRTDTTYPAGFQDVITLEKSGEFFRILYDVKGRFAVHRISQEEASYKLCRVKRVQLGQKGVPFVALHDGRTIRYPDPSIRVNDTVKVVLPTRADGGAANAKGTSSTPATAGTSSATIEDVIPFQTGALATITGGRNMGRIGTILSRDRHHGGFDIVHMRDTMGGEFSTRISNVFVIGTGAGKPAISLPKGKGLKLSIAQERDQRRHAKERA